MVDATSGAARPTRTMRVMSLAVGLAFVAGASAETGVKDYSRAERFLKWNADKFVANGELTHHWIGDTDRFWYARDTDEGEQYIVVDAATLEREAVIDPSELKTKAPAGVPGDLVSPDGRRSVFLREHDLWLRSPDDDTLSRLTDDGQEHYAYGRLAGSSTMAVTLDRLEARMPPVALWSPDSSKVLTHRLDERNVDSLHLLQYAPDEGNVRPVLHTYRYAMPGDEHKPLSELVIIDVDSGAATTVDLPPLPVTFLGPISDNRVWWDADSGKVYVLPREEGQKTLALLAANVATGEVVTLIEEHSDTYVDAAADGTGPPSVRVLANGEIIWYSERDGWGHLYLYDGAGKLIRQLTKGAWQVRSIVHVDEVERRVYFTGGGREAGRDPYLRHLYVVNLDGSDVVLLTPEDADHDIKVEMSGIQAMLTPDAPGPQEVGFSPSGRYFVDSYSRPDLPPVTVVRSVDGKLITTVEKADISALEAGGLTLPEPFSVTAADGKTTLYGTLFRPSNYDPEATYPVLDSIYPGPQMPRTQKTFIGALFDRMEAQTLAELGFIVITIDGRGTPFRSKAFHDVSYGNLGQAGNLEDHIAGIRQLAERYRYMDLNRVGIYGHSGGGFASARAVLAYPDFYKVAVASAGNHDQRGYLLVWGGTYQGLLDGENYDNANNAYLAANLKGKLLLVHGDMDDNVHPALTLQLADALIKANKDFDFLLLPNANHAFAGSETYFARKRWDYFVRHLLGADPPEAYQISGPEPPQTVKSGE